MGSSSFRRFIAAVVLVAALGHGQEALAVYPAPDFREFNKVMCGGFLVAHSVGNLAISGVQLGFIIKGKRTVGLSIGSYVMGAIGIAAGTSGLSLADSMNSDGLRGIGVVAIATSGLNMVLATVNLIKPASKERQQLSLTPVTLVDASGKLSAGAGLTGTF